MHTHMWGERAESGYQRGGVNEGPYAAARSLAGTGRVGRAAALLCRLVIVASISTGLVKAGPYTGVSPLVGGCATLATATCSTSSWASPASAAPACLAGRPTLAVVAGWSTATRTVRAVAFVVSAIVVPVLVTGAVGEDEFFILRLGYERVEHLHAEVL